MRGLCAGLSLAAVIVTASRADAQGVDKWRISEVVTAIDGDPGKQYIELSYPTASPTGCFFNSTRIEVFFSDGSLLGMQAPWSATECSPGQTYTLATAGAETRLGFTAQKRLLVPLPRAAGQICFRSSTIRYDCVRWGDVPAMGAVRDLSNPNDASSADPPPSDWSLTRVADSENVSADFITYPPTPGVVNPIERTDGGLVGPDAGAIPDGALPDVNIPDAFVPPDASDGGAADRSLADRQDSSLADVAVVDVRFAADAAEVPRFDAGGGGCGCRSAGRTGKGTLVCSLLLAAGFVALVIVRRRR